MAPHRARERLVLVVDDDPDILQTLALCLTSEGYNVLMASNGQEALELLRQQKPACILLDLMMPVMDGFTTLEALRTDERTRSIPVVILSALSSGEVRRRCHDMGVRAILQKPYKPEDLLRAVEGSQLVDANS
jgi:CheY-like chemotaxis protein